MGPGRGWHVLTCGKSQAKAPAPAGPSGGSLSGRQERCSADRPMHTGRVLWGLGSLRDAPVAGERRPLWVDLAPSGVCVEARSPPLPGPRRRWAG